MSLKQFFSYNCSTKNVYWWNHKLLKTFMKTLLKAKRFIKYFFFCIFQFTIKYSNVIFFVFRKKSRLIYFPLWKKLNLLIKFCIIILRAWRTIITFLLKFYSCLEKEPSLKERFWKKMDSFWDYIDKEKSSFFKCLVT